MSVKNPAEQIIVTRYDPDWPRQRAQLLLLLGIGDGPDTDFCPAEEPEIKIGAGDLSPTSTKFSDFDIFFQRL